MVVWWLPAGQRLRVVALGSLSLLLAACGADSGAPYVVSAAVSGLQAGKSLLLLNNGADGMLISANGTTAFTKPIASGDSYSVTVESQPSGETCAASPGSSASGSSTVNVTVALTCKPDPYRIGGTVTGLMSNGRVVLQNNHADTATISANGSFVFPSAALSGSQYAVTVLTPPAGETCAVTGGTGTVGAANVTTVAVDCAPLSFKLSVEIFGIATTAGLMLQNNGGDRLAAPASGAYAFSTPVASGSSYAVTVAAQPAGETCFVMGGSGTVTTADVAVNVVCPWNVVYMSAPGANAIYGYYIDETMGTLLPFESGPYASGNAPGFIALSAGAAYVLTGDNTLWVYTIDPVTGALDPVPSSPVPLGAAPYEITVGRAGAGDTAYIPAANIGPPSNTVYGFDIDPSTSAFTAMPGSPYVIGNDPVSVALNPAGTLAYVAASQQIYAYRIDGTTGALTTIPGSPYSAGYAYPPTTGNFVVDPTGRFLYEGSDSVYAFGIDATTGALIPVAGSPFAVLGVGGRVGMRLDPTGRFLYVLTTDLQSVDTWSAEISSYAVDASSGALTPLSGTPIVQYPDSQMPFDLSIDPSGTYLFLQNYAIFRIDGATGALSEDVPWPTFHPGVDTRFIAIGSLH